MKDAGSTTEVPAGIVGEMAAEDGLVTFARFMELALTHPTDGYYSRAKRLLGPRGHFSTAPRLSRVFNGAVCRLLEELVDEMAWAAAAGDSAAASTDAMAMIGAAAVRAAGAAAVTVIELGAGEGDLAKAVLEYWHASRADLRGELSYRIVEVGGRLIAGQRQALDKVTRGGWQTGWTGTVEEALRGARTAVVFGNEFVDALPVHLVDVRGAEPVEAWVELGTAASGSVTREVWRGLSVASLAELSLLFPGLDAAALREFTRDGMVELRPAVASLFGDLAAAACPVCLLTIDYGEWFAAPAAGPEPGAAGNAAASTGDGLKSGGSEESARPLRGRSVRGYFRHQVVADLYTRVGRQDLTADVDFGALDVHGRAAGFQTVLFTTVAALLRANGAEERLADLRDQAGRLSEKALDADREATVLQALLDDGGIGGAFKVMLQVKE